MALRKDLDDFDTNGQKGDWCFVNDDTYICLQWGDEHFLGTVVLPIKPVPEHPAHWDWNGNRESPTLSPSILVNPSKPLWHGFLRDGKLETA